MRWPPALARLLGEHPGSPRLLSAPANGMRALGESGGRPWELPTGQEEQGLTSCSGLHMEVAGLRSQAGGKEDEEKVEGGVPGLKSCILSITGVVHSKASLTVLPPPRAFLVDSRGDQVTWPRSEAGLLRGPRQSPNHYLFQ